MSKTTKKAPAIQPMSKALVSQYETAVRAAYESGEPTIKGMRRDMAYNLSRLYIGKAHKTAGYDSFSDYVTAVFPFKEVKPSQLCTWARTAAKFLTKDKNGEVHVLIGDGWEQSSLERLNSVDMADIRRAIDTGNLSPDMSQNDVKAWVSSLPEKNSKPKLVTMWQETVPTPPFNDPLPLPPVPECDIAQPNGEELFHKLYKNGDILYSFYVEQDGNPCFRVYTKVKPEPKKHTVGKSKEEVAADALRALDPETRKALVAKILG